MVNFITGVINLNHLLKVERVISIIWKYRELRIIRVKEIDINYEPPALSSLGFFVVSPKPDLVSLGFKSPRPLFL
jgi:hypothetical protein